MAVDVDGLRPGTWTGCAGIACTACGGEPAAPDFVHRLRRGRAIIRKSPSPLARRRRPPAPAAGRLTYPRRRRVHVPRPQAVHVHDPGRRPPTCTATSTAPLAPKARRSRPVRFRSAPCGRNRGTEGRHVSLLRAWLRLGSPSRSFNRARAPPLSLARDLVARAGRQRSLVEVEQRRGRATVQHDAHGDHR